MMYQSETKPKVVTKNLDDIIKQSTFSTKRNSIDDVIRCQRHLKTQPRHKNPLDKVERCNTSVINHQNESRESQFKQNLLMSKHSLESKEKINFLDLSKVQIKPNTHNFNNKNNKMDFNIKTKNVQNLYSSSKNKLSQQQQNFVNSKVPNNHQMQSLYYNQVDAIFTELQDFLRETRQKVLLKMEKQNQTNGLNSNEIVDQMDQLFIVFKQEVQRLVERYTQPQTYCQVLKPNNRMQKSRKLIRFNQNFQVPEKQKITVKNLANKTSSLKKQIQTKKTNLNTFNQDQFNKFESFIKGQNSINSTIVSDHQEDHQFSQIHTETDAQLLSILVLKNKLNNTIRKYQNSTHISNSNTILNTKSSQVAKQNCQGEYSFRNKHLFDSNHQSINKDNFKIDKKKNQRKSNSQTRNKENREKSIYEIVLEENKRLKTSIYK